MTEKQYQTWIRERVARHVHDSACGQLWCPDYVRPLRSDTPESGRIRNPWFDKPKPRRKVTDLVAVRFVGITALAAVIGLPIWWTGWHLLDRYLGWIWT
jgi:hypothetical protein